MALEETAFVVCANFAMLVVEMSSGGGGVKYRE